MLRLEAVSKKYRRGNEVRAALNDVSLNVSRGQMVGIFGPSRAGKSTLLRIAAGLELPDSGRVLYNGEDLHRMSTSQMRRFRRREVGCVWTEESWSEGLSALEHVALPLLIDGDEHRAAERTARRIMDSCEIGHCSEAEPSELSDGELRRLALTRALVSEPRLLLADCLVSDLSVIDQEQIMLLLASQASERNVAVLITDTRAGSMVRADPLLFLSEGALVQDAPPNDAGGEVIHLPNLAQQRPAADA